MLFALVPSSTWNTGRYFLPLVFAGAHSPLAVADAGTRWNASSFLGVHFIPMETTLATVSAMFIARVALEWHTVLALAYGHATRRTDLRASGPR